MNRRLLMMAPPRGSLRKPGGAGSGSSSGAPPRRASAAPTAKGAGPPSNKNEKKDPRSIAERTTQLSGFAMVAPLKEKRRALANSAAASEKQDAVRAKAAKEVKYSTPAGGARLGGATGEPAARRAQAGAARLTAHALRRPPSKPLPPGAPKPKAAARPSAEALRAARLRRLDGGGDAYDGKLPSIVVAGAKPG